MGWSFRDFFDVDDGLSGHGVVLLRVWIAVLALEESFFSHRRFVPSKFLSSNNFFLFFFSSFCPRLIQGPLRDVELRNAYLVQTNLP